MISRRSLCAAFAYFTVLPIGRNAAGPTHAELFGYLPFIGLLVGAIAGGAALGVFLIAPHALAVATAFGTSIVLTGAVHVDGFLDSCDGLGASVPPERRLEIMKDPHHGTFAIAFAAVAFTAWIAALDALPVWSLPLAAALAAGTGRTVSAANGLLYPYERGGHPSAPLLAIAAAVMLALAFFLGHWVWIGILATAVLTFIAARWSAQRLGGRLVGDVYGALIVIGEIAMLIAIAVLIGR